MFFRYLFNLLNKFRVLNISIFLPVIVIFGMGVMNLYFIAGNSLRPWALRQIMFFLMTSPVYIFLYGVNVPFLMKKINFFYYIPLLLLIYVDLFGHNTMGATRWIRIYKFGLQPSEFMKIGLVLKLASYFSDIERENILKTKYLIKPIIYSVIPIFLVLKQPDLGTAIILIAIVVLIFFIVGVQWWKFAICGVLFLSSTPFIWKYGLYEYQRKRIETFLKPNKNFKKESYNVFNSKLAIGNGGLYGMGVGNGIQTQNIFLPEKHTDFVFASFTEENGFIKAMFLIFLYMYLILNIMYICVKNGNFLYKIIFFGFSSIMFLHIFINIAMVSGFLPVVGIPLPLMSYGGTITLSVFIMVFILLNIDSIDKIRNI
jgi:rod shape determining protein RodA